MSDFFNFTGLTKSQIAVKCIEIVAIILVVVFIALGIESAYKKVNNYINPPIPVADIAANTPIEKIPDKELAQDVNSGLKAAGSDKSITVADAKELKDKIYDRITNTKPDETYVIPPATNAVQVASNAVKEKKIESQIKDEAKAKGADEVLKQPLDNGKTINYYGVTIDKKIAYGAYADIDKDGSAGIYYRNAPVTVAVGQKYEGKGLTSRIMYDLIRH